MMELPEGMEIRRPRMDDVSAVLMLMRVRSQDEYGDASVTAEHIRDFWQAPNFHLTKDAWVVTTRDYSIVGYASVWHMQYTHIHTYFTALPEYDHLPVKSCLIELVERRAREYLAEAPAEARVTLATDIAEVNNVDQELLVQMGYHLARGHYQMEIEMDEPPQPVVWPEGITVRSYIPEQDTRAVFEVEIGAFTGTPGYTPPDFAQWEHFSIKQEGFDPALWFLACEKETIIAICLCRYWADAGFVSPIAVRLPWRRNGLGQALLRHSFAEFYRRGTRVVKLMVDTQNLSGATRLYTRVGMHVTQLHFQYEKELRSGKVE